MPEFSSAFFGILRILGSVLGDTRRRLARRFLLFQPSLEGGRRHIFFPRDFLEKVKLGSTRSKIIAMLGEPDYAQTEVSRWTYSYKEIFLQLVFYPCEGSLRTIVLGFKGIPGKDSIRVAWLEEKLGDLTLATASKYCSSGLDAVEHTLGPRWQELKIEERGGPPNAYQYMTFAALDPLVGALTQSDFQWDFETNKLASNPENVLINWVALSASSFDENWFDWTVTVPSH